MVDKAISDHFLIGCDINMRKSVTIFKREILSRNLTAIGRSNLDVTFLVVFRETLNRHAPVVMRVVTFGRHTLWFNSDMKAAKQERRAAVRDRSQ